MKTKVLTHTPIRIGVCRHALERIKASGTIEGCIRVFDAKGNLHMAQSVDWDVPAGMRSNFKDPPIKGLHVWVEVNGPVTITTDES